VVNRFERSLAAFELALDGDTTAAADSLYALEMFVPADEAPILWTHTGYEEIPINQAVNRLAASRWLLALGDTVRAEELLAWQEVLHPPAVKVNGIVVGLANLQLARIEDARGDREEARGHYLSFLRTDPIDDYADLGAEARAAVARLDEELAEQAAATGAPHAR
jgi:tetratricopeptide (TPR) repeat protein